MNIFVYSDESGVFDAEHNSIFAFGVKIATLEGSNQLLFGVAIIFLPIFRQAKSLPTENERQAFLQGSL